MFKTNTQTSVKFSRRVVAGIGLFCAISSLGGFMLGLELPNGDFLAIACLTSGIALTSYLWWDFSKVEEYLAGLNLLLLMSFVLMAGFALYSILAWGLWALDYPMSLGTVKNGQMAENYWLGPCALLYAVLIWITLKFQSRKE